MRVALISRNLHAADAVGQQVLAKLHFFQQRGAEVRMFLAEPCKPEPQWKAINYTVGSAKEIWKHPEHRDYLQSCDWVIAEFAAAYSLFDLLPALQQAGPRVLVDYHGITPLELAEEGLQSDIIQANRQRALLWCAEAVIVHSQFAARELQQAINLPAERIHIIPCRVEFSAQQQDFQTSTQRLRQPFGAAKLLLFSGRLARNKQPEMLIEAVASLTNAAQPSHAIFIGKQDDVYETRLKSCRSSARQLGVEKNVHFLGNVSKEHLHAWYRAADVLILPSQHECFGMPIVEAMMAGTPVIGLQAGSLPEVIGHAGYTVRNKHELVSQLQQMFSKPVACNTKRIAVVTHRFGEQFAGGAEKSLRTMARALQQQGYMVDIYTTCNMHESRWSNSLPAGVTHEDGFEVHRFPIDAYHPAELDEAYARINQRNGKVEQKIEQLYLNNSLSSQALIAALQPKSDQYQAIITGPYLFKLTHDVVQAFGSRVLLAPCFHDEPLSRLDAFRSVYRQAGGMLFHTEVEADYTSQALGMHHPRHAVIGTVLDQAAFQADASTGKRMCGDNYLVYVGRYCPEKGLDCLIDLVEQINQKLQQPVKLVCMGQGPLKFPTKPWLIDLGFVDETCKRDVIAGAMALVNLSRQESLSLVALEAWALGVPVLIHAQCPVLKEQVKRSQGGMAIASVDDLQAAIDGWRQKPEQRIATGERGKAWVMQEYASSDRYGKKLDQLIKSLSQPICDIAREQGKRRAQLFSYTNWDERLDDILDSIWSEAPRQDQAQVEIDLLQQAIMLDSDVRSTTLTLRIRNTGDTLLAAHGPARCSWLMKWLNGSQDIVESTQKISMTSALIPGQEQMCVLSLDIPDHGDITGLQLIFQQNDVILFSHLLEVHNRDQSMSAATLQKPIVVTEPLLRQLKALLAEAKQFEKLPESYHDVTEGLLAPLKKQVKHKLLNNFRKAYVDVAFRQQSDLNEKLILGMSLLQEAIAAQDVARQAAEQARRIRKLEKQAKKNRRLIRLLQQQLQQWQTPAQTGLEGKST